MAKLGFFSVLLDDRMSFHEAAAINSASDRADQAMLETELVGEAMRRLEARVQRQERELARLRALVGVLAGVLRDTGVVDASLLDYRVEAALEEVEAAATAPRVAPPITCGRCGAKVPASCTVVTGDGTFCDACAATP